MMFLEHESAHSVSFRLLVEIHVTDNIGCTTGYLKGTTVFSSGLHPATLLASSAMHDETRQTKYNVLRSVEEVGYPWGEGRGEHFCCCATAGVKDGLCHIHVRVRRSRRSQVKARISSAGFVASHGIACTSVTLECHTIKHW